MYVQVVGHEVDRVRMPDVDDAMRFAELMLDENALHTPAGVMPLSEITRAELVREVVPGGSAPNTRQTSAPAVVGGAIVGGALLGPAGAIAGGLLGSTYKEEVPGTPEYRTASVKIVFETDDLLYSMDIAREEELEASHFTQAVRRAVKHSR